MKPIATADLVLEPLTAAHAESMFEVLADPELHRHLDAPPPTSVESLRQRYARLEERRSPDGTERWLNWAIRLRGGAIIGYVQATVVPPDLAWVAFVVSRSHWGRGYAHQATRAVLEHLAADDQARVFLATVEAKNERSIRLLLRLGFHPASSEEAAGHRLTASEQLFVLRA